MPHDRGTHNPTSPEPGGGLSDRLDAWKDVAAYLRRDVSTVQRWERREGLPIHRHVHDTVGSIYAYRHELDAWQRGREPRVPLPDTTPTTLVRPQRRRLAGVALVACVAAILAAVGRDRSGDPPHRIASIAVLPFANLSGDPNQDHLAAGLTEELISRLARLRSLRVVSRTTAASVQARLSSVREMAQALDVDAVVEGSVRREAGRVRISVQLIEGSSDTHVWARDFDRDASRVLALQSEVAREVAGEIRALVAGDERDERAVVPAVDPAAHDEYRLGRHLLWKFVDEDRLRAIAHFTRAAELAPEYAAAHAGLAHAWWMQGVFGPLSLRDVTEPARAAAERALALDDRLTEAYAAKAYVQGMFDWDWAGAETTIQRALTIRPNSLEARYVYALLLMAMGRLDESVEQIDEAARLDPLSAQVQSTFGRILYRARRYHEAIERLERARELEPRNAGTYGRLGDVYTHMGRHDQAIAAFNRARAVSGRPAAYGARVAVVYARMGREREAREQSRDLAAAVHVALGDRDRAFAHLFEAVERHTDWPLFITRDPDYDALHGDPRWRELLRRMNLPVAR